MQPTLARATEYIREHHSDAVVAEDESIDLSSALETVAGWLERVADRDPILFRQLSDKIRAQSQPEVKLEPEGVNNA